MSKVENYGKSIAVKKQQLESLEASVDVASKLFQNARAEYVEVLLAQRDLMDARIVLIDTKKQQLSAIVNAYQALGGGNLCAGPTQNPYLAASDLPFQAGVEPPLLAGVEPLPAPRKKADTP
jgi:outer membrane protein TolC